MKDYKYIQDRRTGTKHRILGVVDNTLTEEGIAADAKVVGDALATKAENDGSYESMTVGNAEQLISTVYEEDSVPYTFRTSGGSIDIGDREEDTLIGGTVAWNQFVQNGDFATVSGWAGVRGSVAVSNNVLTYTITELGGGGQQNRIEHSANILANHVIYITFDIKPSNAAKTQTMFSNTGGIYQGVGGFVSVNANIWTKIGFVFKANNGYATVRTGFGAGGSSDTFAAGDTVQYRNFMVVDLTQLFGSTIADYIYTLEQTTAGAGVAWFRKLFPKDYYAYNPGELLSVSDLQSHDMVGFNQWDEVWELGTINSSTGENEPNSSYIRSKNYIPIVPNTNYYFKTSKPLRLVYYDTNKAFVGIANGNNTVGTTPSNARYLRFYPNSNEYGTTYKNDICINLSWDGERDGEYEPYKKWSYPLDDSLTLRGIPKLDADNKLYYDGDVYESDGTVTRKYGIVNLGSLTWTYNSSGIPFRSSSVLTDAKLPADATGKPNAVCPKYLVSPYNTVSTDDKTITIIFSSSGLAGQVWVRDSAYSDKDTFKTAMDGVYLVYELATPTTESADPYQEVQIVDDFGTEEYVTTSIVPVGHETKYQPNLRAKLEMAPNSPDGNGDYIVRHTNGENVYVPLAFPADELPPAPTEDGTYRLTVTVSNGTATYAWVSA